MLALIPARGGSKGLPGKNIRLLNGKPLIAYTIEAALASSFVKRVIVSTDDISIAQIAVQHGAEVPFLRPANLATDETLSIDVYCDIISRLEKQTQEEINEFIVLQPTSPLRNSHHIDEAISLFRDKNANSVISYCEEHHPIVWHKRITEDGRFQDIFPHSIKNRQDEQKSYFPNGAIYILDKSVLLSRNYYTDSSYAYIMDRKYSIDIDKLEDFEYCEFLLKTNA